MRDIVEQLRTLAQGRTIVSVEGHDTIYSVCVLTLDNGLRLRLCVTDMGDAWVEETPSEGSLLGSLDLLAREVEGHWSLLRHFPEYRGRETGPTKVTREGDVLSVRTLDGRVFRLDLLALPERERLALEIQGALDILSEAVLMGNCWRTLYNPHYGGTHEMWQVFRPSDCDSGSE